MRYFSGCFALCALQLRLCVSIYVFGLLLAGVLLVTRLGTPSDDLIDLMS